MKKRFSQPGNAGPALRTGWIRVVLAALLVAALAAVPAGANQAGIVDQPGSSFEAALDVEGSPIELEAAPGTTVTASLFLTAAAGQAEANYSVQVAGLGQDPYEGAYIALPASEDTGPYTARPFVRVAPASIAVGPDRRAEVTVTIAVPADARDGGRYAAVQISKGDGPQGDAMDALNSVTVPVLLTLKGGAVTETAEITGIEVMTNETGGSPDVGTSFVNTGNHHFSGVVNTVTLTDAAGRTLGTARSEPSAFPVIPGQQLQMRVTIPVNKPGPSFNLTTRLERKDGTVLAEQEESFDTGDGQQGNETATTTATTARAPGFGVALTVLGAGLGIAGAYRRARLGR